MIEELIEKLNNEEDDYIKYNLLKEIESFAKSASKEITCLDGNIPYYNLAVSYLLNDVIDYLNKYKDENKTSCYQLYEITPMRSFKYGRSMITSMFLNPFCKDCLNTHGLTPLVNTFKQYNIMKILGLDTSIRILIKEDYDRFMEIRNNNPEYFVEYIKEILEKMKGIESKIK